MGEQEAALVERRSIRAEKAQALVQELEQWAIDHQINIGPSPLWEKW